MSQTKNEFWFLVLLTAVVGLITGASVFLEILSSLDKYLHEKLNERYAPTC